jgi:hypothetical protein
LITETTYGTTIEKLKAEHAQQRRADAVAAKATKLRRSEIEVALDEIHDDLVFSGVKRPTAADVVLVYVRHHHQGEDTGYPATLSQGFGDW